MKTPLRAPSFVRRAPAGGFTLVEVLVALFILAILAGMAFRGVDALVRAKDGAQAATNRTLKVNTGMSQFEYDMAQMVNTQVLDPAAFNGATLRITRRTPDGLQLVVWSLQDGRWQRWASASVTHVSELQDAWMRSQQWDSISGNAITVLDNVTAFNAYSYCNGWGNFQSSCGNAAPTPPPPTGTVVPPPVKSSAGGDYPTGIRIQLTLQEGQITRERELPAL